MDFFDMVKKWTVSDYCTPGIKAEIILDMLISEFIEDILQYHYSDKGQKEKVTLLAKEFPIRTNEDNYLNAKVDYLVSVGNKKLVLVELKTTNDSFSNVQETRMEEAVNNGAEKLIEFYSDIAKIKNGNSSDRKKYNYSFDKFKANLAKVQLDEETVKAVPELDYLYFFLIDSPKSEDKKLILSKYCADEKFQKSLNENKRCIWKEVSEILTECMLELQK